MQGPVLGQGRFAFDIYIQLRQLKNRIIKFSSAHNAQFLGTCWWVSAFAERKAPWGDVYLFPSKECTTKTTFFQTPSRYKNQSIRETNRIDKAVHVYAVRW